MKNEQSGENRTEVASALKRSGVLSSMVADGETGGLVSVIIPTYNRADLVIQAIESALSQTYRNIEVIVVDDGSTDDTRTRVLEYSGDARLQYHFQKNNGVAGARNAGLRIAKGEYVAFLDSDDRWKDWKIEMEVAVLEWNKEVSLVFSDYSAEEEGVFYKSFIRMYFPVLDRLGLKYSEMFPHSKPLSEFVMTSECMPDVGESRVYWGNIFQYVFQGNFIKTSTTVARKKYINEMKGFNVSYRTGEDADLYLRICCKYPVAFLDVQTAYYSTSSEGRLSGDDYSLLVMKNWYKSQKNIILELGDSYKNSNGFFDIVISHRALRLGKALLKEGNYKEARIYLKDSNAYNLVVWRAYVLYALSFFPLSVGIDLYRKIKSIRFIVLSRFLENRKQI
jgi:glycosyltransferase involved in cell wall biosynthesis